MNAATNQIKISNSVKQPNLLRITIHPENQIFAVGRNQLPIQKHEQKSHVKAAVREEPTSCRELLSLPLAADFNIYLYFFFTMNL